MTSKSGSLVPAIVLDADSVGDREGSFPEMTRGGPKTPAGKRRSSLNALRSGLYADAVLVKGEDRDEYLRFARAVVAGLDVQTALEMAMAERVVSALWRSRRARRYEQAHLNRFADEAAEKRKALEGAQQTFADHELGRDAVLNLASGEGLSAKDLGAAAQAIAEVYWGVAEEDRDDENLPGRFWELFPEKGRALRKRVAAIASEVREIFLKLYVAASADEFWSWVVERMDSTGRDLQGKRDEAATAYAKVLPSTFVLDREQGPWPDQAGRVLADAESRLDRQVSRTLADLEAARKLRPKREVETKFEAPGTALSGGNHPDVPFS